MTDAPPTPSSPDALEVTARLVLFGFPASEALARIRPRSRNWRVGGSIQIMAAFIAIAPLVALVPPHAPWPLGALGVGGILARRRWIERFTLVTLETSCPKCATPAVSKPTRLRSPHTITCEGCHHSSVLKVPADLLSSGP